MNCLPFSPPEFHAECAADGAGFSWLNVDFKLICVQNGGDTVGRGHAVMRDFTTGINYGASDPGAIPQPLPVK